MWSFWDEIVIRITTPDLSCEIERSCNEKLARTRHKVVVVSMWTKGCLPGFVQDFDLLIMLKGKVLARLKVWKFSVDKVFELRSD